MMVILSNGAYVEGDKVTEDQLDKLNAPSEHHLEK